MQNLIDEIKKTSGEMARRGLAEFVFTLPLGMGLFCMEDIFK